jgi:hypothetical protein|tara:strand:+ start:828 stop:1640 length:813 start_codon:yes stop_codon:yes gene_type:complete
MAYPKITVNTTQAIHVTPSNSIPIPNPNFLAAIGTGNFVTTGTTTNTVANKLIDASATFQAANPPLPIIIGDVAYNITNTANAAVTAVDSGTQLTLASDAFQAGGNSENYKIVRQNSLIDEEINFVSLGVKVGDIVVNTDNAGIATVTAVGNEDQLTLSANIFGSLTTADDNFRIYSQQEGSEYYPPYLGNNGGSSTTTNNPGCLIYVGDTSVINTGADATSNQFKNVTVRTVSGEIISFNNFPVGEYLPIQVVQVMSSGTSANSLIGIW